MAHQEEKWNFDQTKEALNPAKTPGIQAESRRKGRISREGNREQKEAGKREQQRSAKIQQSD